jgi:hypothetical protein
MKTVQSDPSKAFVLMEGLTEDQSRSVMKQAKDQANHAQCIATDDPRLKGK